MDKADETWTLLAPYVHPASYFAIYPDTGFSPGTSLSVMGRKGVVGGTLTVSTIPSQNGGFTTSSPVPGASFQRSDPPNIRTSLSWLYSRLCGGYEKHVYHSCQSFASNASGKTPKRSGVPEQLKSAIGLPILSILSFAASVVAEPGKFRPLLTLTSATTATTGRLEQAAQAPPIRQPQPP